MVEEFSLVGGPSLTYLCAIIPYLLFESLWKTLFTLFDSSRMGMRLHMREGIKDTIFILNLNPSSLS